MPSFISFKMFLLDTQSGTYLNWQKMSAYSGEMAEACSSVTRNWNVWPIFRWDGSSLTSISVDTAVLSPSPSASFFSSTTLLSLSAVEEIIFIGYWFDMEIHVQVLVRSNIV